MNLRSFTMAILVSALPLVTQAEGVSFDRQDFISAKSIARDRSLWAHGDSGADHDVIVSVKLSKSGKAKLKKLNQISVGKQIHTDIAGVTSDLTLKEPIRGDGLEIGPYPQNEAEKVVQEINRK